MSGSERYGQTDYSRDDRIDVPATQSIPVIEESLQITKELIHRGGVRVTKRVETHEQLVDELLRSDHVEVERRHVNTAIAGDVAPTIRQEGDTLIVPVVEEILITIKRLVLVEEVRITRTQRTSHKPQSFTLRKEHIEVERLAAGDPPEDELS